MANNKHRNKTLTVCFLNFDTISKKLILSRLNDPAYAIELSDEPLDSDVCFYNQESLDEKDEIHNHIDRLNEIHVPVILLTDYDFDTEVDSVSIIIKPIENRKLSDYLYQVKAVFYEASDTRLAYKASLSVVKEIYNKHLSNAINPSQIKFEGNRFYAQKYVGLYPDIDFADETQLKNIVINPDNYFYTYLRKGFNLSKKKKRLVCVKTVYGVFYVNAKDKIILHDKSAKEIFNIHKIPFYKDTKVYIPKLKRKDMKVLENMYQFDYEPFVWLSSINASKGKIPQDTNISAPIKLVAWPDLTKLIVFKHAIRIIALWSRGVYSIKNTAHLLNIPQRYPLTVFTAMNALDLITEVKKR